MKLKSEELGSVGEALFNQLSASALLIANSSNIDRKGWDFFVQPSEQRYDTETTLDKRSEWSCHVQLKTTAEKRPKSVKVKLSTFESFAKLPGPSLLIVFALHPDGRPKKGYIVHILGEHLRRVLRRLRLAEAKADAKLTKETLSFDYKAKGSAFDLTPEGLRAAIENVIGDDYRYYVKEKQRQLAGLGYEDAEIVGHAVLRVEREDQLARVALGLEPLKTSEMTFFDARFGVLIPYTGSIFEGLDEVYVDPPAIEGWRVSIRSANPLEAAASFDVKVHTVPAQLNGPRVLLKHDDFTIIFYGNELKFETVDLFSGTRRSLDDWCNLLRGLTQFAVGKGSLAITTGRGDTFHFPVDETLDGPCLELLPKLRDFLEGWRRIVQLAGVSAAETFTLEEAQEGLAAQTAVGVLLNADPPGYIEIDVEGEGGVNELSALYYDSCAFAGAEISYCVRVSLQRVQANEPTFRSTKFELVDVRPIATDVKKYGREYADREGLHILLDPDLIEKI